MTGERLNLRSRQHPPVKIAAATADSGEELLRLIGVFLLAQEGKDAPSAASPAVAKDVSAAERRLSAKWNRLQEERRLSRLDELIEEARTRVVAVKK
jgi:hypothetical protein